MPVRYSNSSVLRWPDRKRVDRALREWAALRAFERDDLLALGVYGSFVSGNWGVGSDLDLVAVLSDSSEPFPRRAAAWPLERLPVPADLLVYTREEFARLLAREDRFARTLANDVHWIVWRASPV